MSVNEYVKIGIVVVVVGAVFAFLWRRGMLARLTAYISQTRDELKKCTWPSRAELKGSTVVVIISTLLLGAFTVVVDIAVRWVVNQITHL
ncbi:MAG: preprotein translocase subunit SecE [Verrucomicrobia bacterium]|nr:preprotein translocase subunit SecE [Verrucomicrobiota bacterium]